MSASVRAKRTIGWWLLGVAAALAGCRPPPPRISERLVWTPAAEVGLADASGGKSELAVSPGDVVRIAGVAGPVKVGEVARTSDGEVVVWRTLAPSNGVVFLRPDIGSTSIRAASEVLRLAHVGAAEDPGYGWFALEEQALAWAESPLGTPFPAIAPAARLPPETAELDDVLRASPGAPPRAIGAIRAVVALRTVRALEGVRRYPYERDRPLTLTGAGPARRIGEDELASIDDGRPVATRVDGPADLVFTLRAKRAVQDAVLTVTIDEDGRRRGGLRGTIPKLSTAEEVPAADRAKLPPDVALLRRIHVAVPPGSHTYRLTPQGAGVLAMATEVHAAVQLGDALSGAKDEATLLARAREACGAGGPACAIALALAGDDGGPDFARTLAASPAKAQGLATRLATGEPLDRAASLESAAIDAVSPTVDALGRAVAETIDASLRGAWARATGRETAWQATSEDRERMWFAFLPPAELPETCKAGPPKDKAWAPPPEQVLGANALSVPSAPWRRAQIVRLLVTAPCGALAPIKLEVDGEVLVAQPHAERAMWNVVVKGASSSLKRIDAGPGKVVVLSADPCVTRGTFMRAPDPIKGTLPVAFPSGARSPGVELWVREGSGVRSIEVTGKDGQSLSAIASPEPTALAALDEHAARWLRAGRVPLPSWSAAGITIAGPPDVAIRPVVRAPRLAETPEKAFARPADAAAVTALSKRLIEAKDDAQRAAIHLERALLLASYGMPTAADDDAAFARSLGAKGKAGEDAVAFVNAAVLPDKPKPLADVSAYGLEPDFDPSAPRCKAPIDSPRARLAALDVEARTRAPDAPLDHVFAARVSDAVLHAKGDPRSESLMLLAMPSSKWQLLRDDPPRLDPRSRPPPQLARVEGGGGRVPRPYDATRDPLLDGDGRLRARIVAGDPFGERFVSVTHEHPARAFVADRGRAKGRIDYVCVARRPSESARRCPLKVRVGEGAAIDVPVAPSGTGSLSLPAVKGRGKGAELTIEVGEGDPEWLALVRIVFDAKVIGATEVGGVGWVLDTPHMQYRFLVGPREPVRVKLKGPTILRIDAAPEPGGDPDAVTATVDGREVEIPFDGRPIVVSASGGSDVSIESKGAKATLAIAERTPAPARISASQLVRLRDADKAGAMGDVTSARVEVGDGPWRDRVLASDAPRSGFVEALGTLGVSSGIVAQSIREGVRIDSAPDAFLLENVSYRRTIASIGLSSLVAGSLHLRDAATSYGGHVGLFENIEPAHVRIGAYADLFAQQVEVTRGIESSESTLRPRAFVEYAWRALPNLLLEPRLGYDGYYSTLRRTPISARFVDDAVYNAFRLHRQSLLNAQVLLRYAPHFNDALYVRPRVNFDVGNGQLSHATVRGGGTVVFDLTMLDLSADAQYFARTPGARSTSSIDAILNAGVMQHLPITAQSLAVQIGGHGGYRVSDGTYQVLGVVSFTASAGRGTRDFSMAELVFREQLPAGAPWSAGAEGLR